MSMCICTWTMLAFDCGQVLITLEVLTLVDLSQPRQCIPCSVAAIPVAISHRLIAITKFVDTLSERGNRDSSENVEEVLRPAAGEP